MNRVLLKDDYENVGNRKIRILSNIKDNKIPIHYYQPTGVGKTSSLTKFINNESCAIMEYIKNNKFVFLNHISLVKSPSVNYFENHIKRKTKIQKWYDNIKEKFFLLKCLGGFFKYLKIFTKTKEQIKFAIEKEK